MHDASTQMREGVPASCLARGTHCCAVTIHHNVPPLQLLRQLLLHSGAAVAPPAPRLIQQNPSVFVAHPTGILRKKTQRFSMLDT